MKELKSVCCRVVNVQCVQSAFITQGSFQEAKLAELLVLPPSDVGKLSLCHHHYVLTASTRRPWLEPLIIVYLISLASFSLMPANPVFGINFFYRRTT